MNEDPLAQMTFAGPFYGLVALVALASAWVAWISMLEACERAFTGPLR